MDTIKAQNRTSLLLLALILILGGALRFYRLNWDDSHHVHPDERYITWVATSIALPAKLNTWEGWQAALDPRRSTLNPFYWSPQADAYNVEVPQDEPRDFAYGHLPLYLLALAAHGLAALTHQPDWLSYDSLALVGRAIACIFDLGTIVVTFLLGRRLPYGGRAVGLLAAALVACAPQHIQLAHFYTVDTPMTFFIIAALWLFVRYLQNGRPRDALAAGVCAGLAIGCKSTAVWLLVIMLLPLVMSLWYALRCNDWTAFIVSRPLIGLLLAAGLTFAITNPFALIEVRAFLSEISRQSGMARGALDWPYTRQYYQTLPYVYQIWQSLRFGLGPALGLAGWGGFAWAVWRVCRRTLRLDELIFVAWIVSYLGLTGALYVKFIRYMLPIIPPLAILAAALLVAIAQKKYWLGRVLALTIVALTALAGLALANMYSSEHPWVVASRWIYANAPAGSFLAGEHWDDRLPLPLDEKNLPTRSSYHFIELTPYDSPDSSEKLEALLQDLSGSDYLILPTHRLWGTIPRWPGRYPLTAQYYHALFAGQLGFQLEFFAARYPHLGPISFIDQPLTDPALPIPTLLQDWQPSPIDIGLGRADESFTVYDHPLVLVFRNVARLSPEQMLARITSD